MRFDARLRPLVVAAAFLVLALHALGAADVTGDDEAREAGIVQDVLAGHVLWPRFNGELIPDKPILYHWLAAVPCAVAGFSEAAVRLPSALAGAALVGWIAWFGARTLATPAAGIAAGALLATFPAFFARARVARPDLVMLVFLAPALGLAYGWWCRRRRPDAVGALVLLGFATLAKGPVAPALFATTLVAFAVWQRDPLRLRGLATAPGLAAFVVLGLGWYGLALAGWGDEFVRQHLVGRYLRNLAGGLVEGRAYSPKSLWYHATFYPVHLPLIALPWTPLVVAAVVRAWRRGAGRSPLVRFLVCWALAPVVVFTPAEYKLRYYLLPSLPALALLAAPFVAELVARPLGHFRATRASIAVGVVVLVCGAIAAAVVLEHPERLARSDQATLEELLDAAPARAAGAAVVVGLGLGVLAASTALRAWGPLVALTGGLTAGWLAVGAPATELRTNARRSFRPFAQAVRDRYPPGTNVAFYGEPVRAVVVYVGRPVPSLSRDARRITPGLGVIATLPAYQALAEHGYVGPTLELGTGQTGNLERDQLVLAAGVERSAE